MSCCMDEISAARICSHGWAPAVSPPVIAGQGALTSKDRPPLLLPQEVQAISDGCAAWDNTVANWKSNLRDQLLFALLAKCCPRILRCRRRLLAIRELGYRAARASSPVRH